MKKAGGYSDRNVELQLTTIKIRTTVQKITHKILHIKLHLRNSDRKHHLHFSTLTMTG